MSDKKVDDLRRKIAPSFIERMRLAEAAWADYREVNPYALPEKMPSVFHAGFTLGCAEMEKRAGGPDGEH